MTQNEPIPLHADAARDAGSNDSARPTHGNVSYPPLPDDAMLILPVRNMVLFPGIVAPVSIGRERSLAAVQEAVRLERQLSNVHRRNTG